MKFFWQGEIETRYDLDFRSYLQHLESIDRCERVPALRALPVGKIRLPAIALEESDYTKTGGWPKSIKLSTRALLIEAPAEESLHVREPIFAGTLRF